MAKKSELRRNIIPKLLSGVLYVFGIVFICAGVVGIMSLDNQTFKDTKALNNNLDKTVSLGL